MRNVILSSEFEQYYAALPAQVKIKFDYAINILQTVAVPNTKFVKKIQNSEFYEMRVSVGTNEYRSLLFSIDNDNIINATQVLILNSFLKKSNKDYPKQIAIAENILKQFEQ
ncbi:MAG: type II toxin-antitoxin system RelE/ParE family toxin [Paludibacteraceae bacterium]|nr:type II toxin-antitoxin system RelE/ParE family toxin [Paludibacteraceae bacterium]